MKGHEQILSLRAKGFKPTAIFIEDRNPPARVNWEIATGALPAVYVGRDNPRLSDLRFATGVRVHLSANNSARADQWVRGLLDAGASQVIQSTQGEIDVWQP